MPAASTQTLLCKSCDAMRTFQPIDATGAIACVVCGVARAAPRAETDRGPEDEMSLEELRSRAGHGRTLVVSVDFLLALIEERNKLEDDVRELRAALTAKKGVPDGATP